MTTFTNPITYLILLTLAVACTLYAYGYIRPTRSANPDHGQTALFVILGDSAVTLAAVLIVACTGPVDWLQMLAILLACLAAGGLPMIAEYIGHHTTKRAVQRSIDDLAHLNRILEE
jgi:hypothetical protein